jgi:hypothetical protein
MTRQYTRLLTLAFLGSGLAPLLTYAAFRYRAQHNLAPEGDWIRTATGSLVRWQAFVLVGLVVAATAVVWRALLWFEPRVEATARQQADFLASLPARYVDLAIFGSAALSLFLELAIIRWQATVFEFFAFYKNLSLLACFAGLGLGYALAGRKHIALLFSIPLLCWEFLWMIGMRYGMRDEVYQTLNIMPFREQLTMGLTTCAFAPITTAP